MTGLSSGPWVLDGHNLSAVIRCTVPRGHPDAKHLTGDYETIARYEGPNWAANARLGAAAPEMHAALVKCQKALAMMIAPGAIKQTTVTHAFAQAVAAESAARLALLKPSQTGDQS